MDINFSIYGLKSPMWYIQLARQLAQEICKSAPEFAADYIEDLFWLVNEQVYKNVPFAIGMLIGFIQDLHKLSKMNQKKEMSLSVFSRLSLGLIILHLKAAEDYYIENAAFLGVMLDDLIFEGLNLENILLQLHKQTHLKDPSIPASICINVLNQIEWEVFAKLDHHVSPNLKTFSNALSELLDQIDNQAGLLTNLLLFIKPFQGKSDEFDNFIVSIEYMRDRANQWQINELCTELESYVSKGKKRNDFWSLSNSSKYEYVKDVAAIVKQINDDKYQDVDSILVLLSQIKITNNKDKLQLLIVSFNSKYGIQNAPNSLVENSLNYAKY